jgi:hypothetical protein
VGALCVAHALADAGELEILAILHNTNLKSATSAIQGTWNVCRTIPEPDPERERSLIVRTVAVINHFYGRPRIPLGAYRGDVGDPSLTTAPPWTHAGKGVYVEQIVESHPEMLRDLAPIEDALTVYRRALSGAMDRSITIISIGVASEYAGAQTST